MERLHVAFPPIGASDYRVVFGTWGIMCLTSGSTRHSAAGGANVLINSFVRHNAG